MGFSLQIAEPYRLKALFLGYSSAKKSLNLIGTGLSFTAGRNANVNLISGQRT